MPKKETNDTKRKKVKIKFLQKKELCRIYFMYLLCMNIVFPSLSFSEWFFFFVCLTILIQFISFVKYEFGINLYIVKWLGKQRKKTGAIHFPCKCSYSLHYYQHFMLYVLDFIFIIFGLIFFFFKLISHLLCCKMCDLLLFFVFVSFAARFYDAQAKTTEEAEKNKN